MAKPIKLKTEPKKIKKPTHKTEKVEDKNWRVIKYTLKENGKKNTWRPSWLTDDILHKLVEEFRYDATVEEACSYAWISVSVFYKWLKEDRNFMEEMDRAIKYPFRMCRNKLLDLANDAEKEELQFKAAQEFLSKRDSRYKAKSENTETTLTEGQNTEELVRNKSMIDLEEMRRKLLSE